MEIRLAILVCLISAILCLQGVLSQCSGKTCDECIASSYKCAWCSEQNFTSTKCQLPSKLLEQGCAQVYLENPESKKDIIENDEVRNSDKNKEAIQVMPQKIKIVTRPGAQNKFDMTFRAANNYPVDLYFLFDSSVSMAVEKENLAALSKDIGRAIGNISTNYQMGYGVFQDKVILPFTDTVPSKLLNPCIKYNKIADPCDPPYEYKHVLSMTNDITKFTATVSRSTSTGNIDHPEGSGDAILQSIICKDDIGWRKVGRKLLIYASNAAFHVAGDGRLAGIVTPSDGQCHLNEQGRYDKELEMDYPSVSQLTEAAANNDVHIIFVASKDHLDLYKELSERIPNSVAAQLKSGPNSQGNIKDIIETKYKQMVSQVTIVHEEIDGVDVMVAATSDKCIQKGSNICKGLEIGTNIEFEVTVMVTECPALPEDRKKTLAIYPSSMSNDKLEVELEITCECDCSSDPATVVNDSEICSNGNGTLRCGTCDCNKDRFGEFCECDASEIDSFTSSCQKTSDSEVCSGNGLCACGRCNCDDGFSGAFCECDDNNCPLFNRKLCGGPTRGKCFCGECICNANYEGTSCDCPTSNAACLHQETMCNDAGTCECGVCKCTKRGYVGKFCESCPLCGDDLCAVEEYKECATCFIDSKNPQEECALHCSTVEGVQLVEALSSDNPGACSLEQVDGCLSFRIEEKENKIGILVQKDKTCPEPVDLIPIIGGVIGGVVAVGLLLLGLWKLMTTVFDKIEYARFQEDLRNCTWAQQDNPFYRGATTTYKNPMLDTAEPFNAEKFNDSE